MSNEQIKDVLDRVLTWPPARQQDAAELLLWLEAKEAELYHPSDDEWAAKILRRRAACNARSWMLSTLSRRFHTQA